MSTNLSRDKSPLTARIASLPPYYWEIGALIVLFLATLVINSRMLRYGLNGTGDLRWHITWVQHFSRQLAEGILYPRWLAGTNFGYGSPTFVFYPPLVYYIASALKFLGLNSEQTFATAFSLAVFLSGLSFYVYGRERWERVAALGGGLFYMTGFSLYNLLAGGALSALFALAWIPIGLYTIDRALDRPRWRLVLAFLWLFVALTHTPSLLIYAIAGGIYTLVAGLQRSVKTAIVTLLFMALGLAMASFYLLPAILEQRFTSIPYVFAFAGNYVDYIGVFRAGFRDPLFKQFLLLAVLAIVASASAWKSVDRKRQVVAAIGASVVILFLLGSWSGWIWQSSSLLQKLETPYRILSLLYFAAACLCAIAIEGALKTRQAWKFFVLTSIALMIFFNLHYGLRLISGVPGLHSPGKGKVFIREWMETGLFDPFSDKLIDVPEYRPPLPRSGNYPAFTRENYSDSGLPLTSAEMRKISPLPVPDIGQPRVSLLDGQARVEIEKWGSYDRRLKVEAATPSTLRIRLYYYPAWRLTVNGQSRPLEMAADGTVLVKVEPGNSIVELSYGMTGASLAGILVALASLSIVLGYGAFLWKQTPSQKVDRAGRLGSESRFAPDAQERPNSRER